jgi:hypothetical protein
MKTSPPSGRGGDIGSSLKKSVDALTNSDASHASQPVLPSLHSFDKQPTIFQYRAQLTFGLSAGAEVLVNALFSQFLETTIRPLPDFSLLPYEDDKGQQVTSVNQIPDNNPSFSRMYYHNHRVLQQGNLTGMISFQCSKPWSELMKPTSPYFQWLSQVKVYLNQTKFKASTLVPCGFLHGAHLGYLHRNEANKELFSCLNKNQKDKVHFQLPARTLSVPIGNGKQEKFSFQAVVIETEAQQASVLRERFYSLGDPL